MAIDKIQAESINLADNFAFTGTVSGAGKIGQVQQSILSSTVSHNTNSYADLGLDVNITPSSTSSKILVFVNGYVGSDTATANVYFDVQRDSTTIIERYCN